MDFKKYLENRLMMIDLQFMRAEDNNSSDSKEMYKAIKLASKQKKASA